MNTYWWFRPSRIALLMVMPLAFFAFTSSDHFYRQFGAFNAITNGKFFLMWLAILAFAGGSWIGEVLLPHKAQRPLEYIPESNYRPLLYGLGFIASAAMFIYLSPFLKRPELVLGVLKGEPGAAFVIRTYVEGIPGVTSFENIFSLVLVLLMAKSKLTGVPRNKGEKWFLVFIFVISALRVVIHGERLALIEIVVPFSLYVCARRRRSSAGALAPVLGIIALFLFFMGTEYLRSWVTWYSGKSDSLLDFALDRMIGYYMTALNNGAYIYSETHSYIWPLFTGAWLWHLPLLDLTSVMAPIVGTNAPDPQDITALLAGQNVEFNNTSGVFAPLIDFGPVLGIIIWLVLGYISGRLFRRFADGHPLGLILFPTWYVGVLEVPRIFYWGDSRYFPSLVISLAVTLFFLLVLRRNQRDTAVRYRIARSEGIQADGARLGRSPAAGNVAPHG